MRILLVMMVVGASAAAAQEDEFAHPDFADAGTAVTPVDAPPAPEPTPPPPPRWSPFTATVNAGLAGLTSYEGWLDGAIYGLAYSTVGVSDAAPGEIEGWLLHVGASGSFGMVGGALCAGSAFCGTRITGGVSARLGWGHGLPGPRDGIARPRFLPFGQLDLLLSHFLIESAPLSPGYSTWEFVTRARGGVMLATGGVTFVFAVVVEGIPVGRGTQGVLLGASVGLSL